MEINGNVTIFPLVRNQNIIRFIAERKYGITRQKTRSTVILLKPLKVQSKNNYIDRTKIIITDVVVIYNNIIY